MGRLAKNKIIFGICTFYVEVIRGTPILVQILFIYFGIPELLGINLDKMTASIIAIAINAGVYLPEIVRGGLQLIDKEQTEAGRSIRLTPSLTLRHIPQPT